MPFDAIGRLASPLGQRFARVVVLAVFTLGAMGTARAQVAATSTAPAPSPPVAPELVPPHLLASGTVPYPEGATGNVVVTLTLVVNRDGTVRSAEVTHGDEPFAGAAVAAARDFRFAPATRVVRQISPGRSHCLTPPIVTRIGIANPGTTLVQR